MPSEVTQAIRLETLVLWRRYLTPSEEPTGSQCHRLEIPDDPRIITAVSEALAILCNPDTWEASEDGLTQIEIAAIMTGMLVKMWNEPCDIGTVKAYATNEIPSNMLPCDGSTYANVDYPLLASRIHDTFIVDSDHFRVPNLSGRTIVGAGQFDPDNDSIMWEVDTFMGDEEVTLTEGQLAAHTHTDTTGHTHGYIGAASTIVEFVVVPAPSAVPAPLATDPAFVTIDNTGGDEPHPNIQPSYSLPYGIVYR